VLCSLGDTHTHTHTHREFIFLIYHYKSDHEETAYCCQQPRYTYPCIQLNTFCTGTVESWLFC